MGEIRVLTESDLRQVVGLDAAELDVIEAVYPIISGGRAAMPPIMRIDVPEHRGEVDIKSAYLPGHPGIAVKVSAGFFDNPARGLASLGGLIVVLDAETGIPVAALFDNGYLTDIRTALAGAVAARHLARDDARLVGIVGAGAQAGLQLEALRLVRSVDRAVVWARRSEQSSWFASTMSAHLGIEVVAVEDVAAAAAADIVVTTTPATAPLIDVEMVRPGTHVTAVGSDAEHKRELSAALVIGADVFACDSVAQSVRLGELRAPVGEGYDSSRAVELGDIIDGSRPGRRSEAEITVCDLTGTGAQDTAIAGLAVTRAIDAGLGTSIVT